MLPLSIFCGAHRLAARLRPADREAADDSLEELQRVVGQLRRPGPRTRIHIRADAGFCREPLLRWGEEHISG